MLAHVCHALHVPNRFNRANLEEIKGYGVLALKGYVLSQKDRRRRAQLFLPGLLAANGACWSPQQIWTGILILSDGPQIAFAGPSGFFPGHLKPVYLNRNR